MNPLLKILKTIASAIGVVIGTWVSVTLLTIGKLTALVTKVKKSQPREL
jgi:hypothetical protein